MVRMGVEVLRPADGSGCTRLSLGGKSLVLQRRRSQHDRSKSII